MTKIVGIPIASLLVIIALLPLLHGCQSTQNNQLKKLPEALRTTAVVTYSNFNRNVPQTGTFAWLPGGTHLLSDPRIDGNKLNRFLRHSLIKSMQQKGFTFSQIGEADLHIGYIASMASDLDDTQIRELYGFDTGWQPTKNLKKYEKGTLILDIIQTHPRRHIWRGAIQANVGFDLSDEVRRQRINMVVRQLLSHFNRDFSKDTGILLGNDPVKWAKNASIANYVARFNYWNTISDI